MERESCRKSKRTATAISIYLETTVHLFDLKRSVEIIDPTADIFVFIIYDLNRPYCTYYTRYEVPTLDQIASLNELLFHRFPQLPNLHD